MVLCAVGLVWTGSPLGAICPPFQPDEDSWIPEPHLVHSHSGCRFFGEANFLKVLWKACQEV